MLIEPSIIKMPDASFPVSMNTGCSVPYTAPQNGNKCTKAFSCKPYAYNSDSCVDCTYDPCSYKLGVGIVGAGMGIVGTGVSIGISIAGPT